MKCYKKIMCVSLFTVVLSTSLLYANPSDETSNIVMKNSENLLYKYKQISINEIFTIENENIKEESEFLKVEMSYPFLKVKDEYENKKHNVKIIKNINNEISTYIKQNEKIVRVESEKYKKLYEDELSKSNDNYVKYQYQVFSEYKVSYNKNNIISIPIKVYNFTGGAHGMTYLKPYNYDLVKGEQINLECLFKEDVDYKELVNNFIQSEIEKNSQLYFSGNEGFKGISDKQDFYIDDDGIVIYFQLYDIAPYYVGIPEFKMTWKEFGQYFKVAK